MSDPAPPPSAPAPPERQEISYRRAMALATTLFAFAVGAGLSGAAIVFGPILVAAFVWEAARRGILRSQSLVMAEVTWLVLAAILKLAFLETLPAAPLPVLAGVLLVQYVAQLAVDLKAFDVPETRTPPVTYAVTYALVPVLAVAAELFRAARANYPPALGVFLAMTIAASFFLLVIVWWDWAKRAFSSLKMAVTLLSLIGLGSVVGTFVIQRMPEETVQAHYEKFMNGEGAAPVNARYLFQDPTIDWSEADEARRGAMNEKFGAGQGDRWAALVRHDRVKKAKEVEGRRFVRSNAQALHAFYEFCDDAELTRIFKSWYFNALLVLLACTVVGVMARRFPYEPRDGGWVATHAGIVFLLLCLAGSDLAVRDGFVEAAPTAEPGTRGVATEVKSFRDIFDHENPRFFPGWTLRLVRTSADWYQQLAVWFVDDAGRVVAEQEYPVLAGKAVELDRPSKDAAPRYRIEMLEALERCRPTGFSYRPGKAGGVTALALRIEEGGRTAERWVTDADPTTVLPGGRLLLVVAKDADDEARAAVPTMRQDMGAVGFVRVVADGKDIARVPATAGATGDFERGGKTWRLAVADVALDANLYLEERKLAAAERTPIERQAPDMGVAALDLSSDGVPSQKAFTFGGSAAEAGNEQMANPVLKGEGLRFYLDLVAPMELRVVARPDGSLVAFRETRGVVAPAQALHEGDALLPEGDELQLTVGGLVRNAVERTDVEPIAPETDADYMKNGLAGVNEQPGFPALKVRVTEPDGEPYETWLLGADPWQRQSPLATRDGRVRMMLGNGIESMYRSAVQAVAPDGTVLGEHVVRVNAPFRMGGYEFYQNQFVRPDQGGPASVFRVKFDPFVPWIYVGFALVAGGVVVLLWFPGQRAFKLHAHLARLPEEGPRSAP